MAIRTVLVVAGLVALVAGSTQARAARIVPFKVFEGIIVLRIAVNGRGPYDFILDTGTTDMVVTPSLARTLRLRANGSDRNGGAGPASMVMPRTSLATIDVGGVRKKAVPAWETALPADLTNGRLGVVVSGLIGTSFLQQYIATLDYASGTMRLDDARTFVPPARAIVLAMSLVAGQRAPAVDVTVDGHRGHFWVDTGTNTWPTIKRAFATTSGIAATNASAPAHKAEAAGGETTQLRVCLRSFGLGSWHRSHVPADLNVVDNGVERWADFDGILGYEILRNFRTTFDFVGRKMYFEPIRTAGHTCS